MNEETKATVLKQWLSIMDKPKSIEEAGTRKQNRPRQAKKQKK